MVSNNALINILRSKGYTFNRQADRVEIWKQKGSTKRVMIRRNTAHDPEYVGIIMRQAGFGDGEILKFLSQYDCRH